MAQIPSDQKFHTLNASTPTVERGSAQADGLREIYTMQDIIDSVSFGSGVASLETLTGALTLVGAGTVSVTNDGISEITITGSGGSGGVETLNALAGAVTVAGGVGITVTDNGIDTITISAAVTDVNGETGSITFTGTGAVDVDVITSTGQIDLDLTDTGVVAATYTHATIDVDAQGRVLTASSGVAGATDLDGLSDATITTPVTAGEVLIYNSTAGAFENATLTQGTGISITNGDGSIEIAATGGGGGVSSLETLTGALTLVGAGTVTVTDDGTSEITITGSGGGGSTTGEKLDFSVRSAPFSSPGDHEGTVLKIGSLGLNVGTVYMWDGTDWGNANAGATATSTGLMGIAIATGAAPGVLSVGFMQLSSPPGVAGDNLYLDTTTGSLTATAPGTPGDVVRVMGYNIDGSLIYFNPSGDWLEI
jgi:hypothetical protein